MNKLKSKIMETYFFDSPYDFLNIPKEVDPQLQSLIFLMSECIGVKRRAKHKYTPMIIASMFGAQKAITKLIERGALHDQTCEFGMNALHYASFFGRLESSRILLQQKNTDVNTQDQLGNTALIFAATHGSVELVQILLKHGADVDLKDMDDNPALFYAHPSCATLITGHQAQKQLEYIKKNGEMTVEGFWQTTTETFRTNFAQNKIAHEFLFEGNMFVISRFKGISIFYKCLDNMEEIEFSYNMDSWKQRENALKKKMNKSGALLEFYLVVEEPDEVTIRGQEIKIQNISYDELEFKVFSTREERLKLRMREDKKIGVDEFFRLYQQQKI
jgi:hypothetical protein